jgi:HK97 family phage prohead protease
VPTSLQERRVAPLSGVELRTSEDGTSVTFTGYAAVYDDEAHGERIAPGAFTKTVNDRADVRFLVNHDGVPLARTKSGTLTLDANDPRGLGVTAQLDRANPRVQELESAMRRGDLDQMSFSFAPVQERDVEGVRELREVKLFDVSAVTFPWYEGTSAEMRTEAVELVTRYAQDLGVELPPIEPEITPDTTATEPVEPPTPTEEPSTEEPATEPETHSLPLDVAARRVALNKHRATQSRVA